MITQSNDNARLNAVDVQPTSRTASSEASRREEAVTQGTPMSAQRESSLPALEALATGLRRVCVNVGVSTCVANAMVDSNAPLPKAGALIQYPPRQWAELLELVAGIRSLESSDAVARVLQKFTHKVRFASVESGKVAFSPPSPFRIPTSSMLQLVHAWRASCSLGHEALQGVEGICRRHDVEIWTCEAWAPLCSLLLEAASGDYSCLQPDGGIVLPAWAEPPSA